MSARAAVEAALKAHAFVVSGICVCGVDVGFGHRSHIAAALDDAGLLAGQDPADEPTEDDLWGQLWETDAARSCSCSSCNPLDYYDLEDEPCILETLIEGIIAARQRLTTQADHPGAAS